MKIKPFEKILVKKYYEVLTAVSVIIAFVFIFDMCACVKVILGIIAIAVTIIICISIWIKANKLDEIQICIGESNVEVRFGDLFQEECKKVIAFNELFDTAVDNKIISETSLNGQYIKNITTDIGALDRHISEDEHLKSHIIKKDVKRKKGKNIKYELGTIHVENDYFLLAFSHVDQDNKSYLYIKDYVDCLLNFWNEVDIFYANQSVSIPLLGAGITRFEGCNNITEQELLDIILWTFKTSKIKFGTSSKLTIVLASDVRDKVNLFEIKEKYNDK